MIEGSSPKNIFERMMAAYRENCPDVLPGPMLTQAIQIHLWWPKVWKYRPKREEGIINKGESLVLADHLVKVFVFVREVELSKTRILNILHEDWIKPQYVSRTVSWSNWSIEAFQEGKNSLLKKSDGHSILGRGRNSLNNVPKEIAIMRNAKPQLNTWK